MSNIPETVPDFVRDLLDQPPAAGAGVHAWLFRVARQLHAHMSPGELAELLADRARGCGRAVPWCEIVSAVRRSQAVAWKPSPALQHRAAPSSQRAGGAVFKGGATLPSQTQAGRWPKVAELARRGVLLNSPSLADLWEASPLRLDEVSAAQVVELLFPGNPLLCCGVSAREFDVKPRQEWGDSLGQMAFIVPSPMTSEFGVTQEGKRSKHTLANTGPRRYLVCEFDQGTPDEHVALLRRFAAWAPLACAVHSGGKSLHGWFNVAGEAEKKIEAFFRYAVSVGADPATWTRSQFVRMPGGRRENGAEQMVCYLNAKAVPRSV